MMINGPSEEQIRARAFELYLERGRQPGHELEDWLQAEFELTHRPFRIAHLLPIQIAEKPFAASAWSVVRALLQTLAGTLRPLPHTHGQSTRWRGDPVRGLPG